MPRQTVIIQAPPIFVAEDNAAIALGVSESTLQAMVRKKDLPSKRIISPGRSGYLWRELVEWAEARPLSDLAPGPGRRQTPRVCCNRSEKD